MASEDSSLDSLFYDDKINRMNKKIWTFQQKTYDEIYERNKIVISTIKPLLSPIQYSAILSKISDDNHHIIKYDTRTPDYFESSVYENNFENLKYFHDTADKIVFTPYYFGYKDFEYNIGTESSCLIKREKHMIN